MPYPEQAATSDKRAPFIDVISKLCSSLGDTIGSLSWAIRMGGDIGVLLTSEYFMIVKRPRAVRRYGRMIKGNE